MSRTDELPTMSAAPEEEPPKEKRPWWVAFALYALPNRRSAFASVLILVWVAGLLVIYGFRDLRYSAGAIVIVPAIIWYLKAITWADRHHGWPTKTRP